MPAALLENLPPGVFGVAKDRADEFGAFVIGRWRLAGLSCGGCGLVHLAGQLPEDLHRVLASDPADPDDQQDRCKAQTFAATKAHPAATAADIIATGIDHVVAASAFFP
ncbi:hypothetical protein D3C87_1302600 [compost metagenome]